MGDLSVLKAAVQAVIRTNGNQEITGQVLQNTLTSIINTLGTGAQYIGIATPSTNPGTPDAKVFYIASANGTYSNFGGITVSNEVVILVNTSGSWVKQTMGFATIGEINGLISQIGTLSSLSTEDKTNLVAAINELLSNINQLSDEVDNLNGSKFSIADLDIADENENVIVRFNKGHIKTKYFDSEKDINKNIDSNSILSTSDLLFADKYGNAVMALGGGHIRTRFFSSKNIVDIIKKYIDTTQIVSTEINGIEINSNSQKCLSIHDSGAGVEENMNIGYIQVLKVANDMYYMYYDASGTATPRDEQGFVTDNKRAIKFAYSTDGMNWVRGFPSYIQNPPADGVNAIQLMAGDRRLDIGSLSVFKAYWDTEYPYRCITSDGSMYIYKSKDGVTFENGKLIDPTLRDCQPSIVVKGNVIKVYNRDKSHPGRNIAVLYCDLEGNMLSPSSYLFGENNLYNSSACRIDDRREMLFPTTFMQYNIPNDPQGLACYIVDGNRVSTVKIDENYFTQNGKFKSLYVSSGGIVDINGEHYLYYSVSEKYHDVKITSDVVPSYDNEIRRIKISLI